MCKEGSQQGWPPDRFSDDFLKRVFFASFLFSHELTIRSCPLCD
jgi:hypothetical protein